MGLHLLTDGDVEVLKGLIAREKARLSNVPNRPVAYSEDEYHQAPEVYVARTPTGGIPALNEGVTGTGTEYEDDVVNSAECDIYQLVEISGIERLRPVEDLSKRVRNLSTTAIAGNQWILIERDKFGYFFHRPGVVIGGGDGDGDVIVVDDTSFWAELLTYNSVTKAYEFAVVEPGPNGTWESGTGTGAEAGDGFAYEVDVRIIKVRTGSGPGAIVRMWPTNLATQEYRFAACCPFPA